MQVHVHEAHCPTGPWTEIRRGIGSAVIVHRWAVIAPSHCATGSFSGRIAFNQSCTQATALLASKWVKWARFC